LSHVADWLAEMSLTDWWPVRVALIVLVVAIVAAIIWWARRWYTRLALAFLALVTVAANLLAGVNAYYGYYLTLGQAIGLPGRDAASLAELDRRTRPPNGIVVGIDIPGGKSRFAARTAQIYLPPAWFSLPRPRLPVLLLLHGTPGSPTDWIDGGTAAQTLDNWASTHQGRTPIVIMPDVNGSLLRDSECVDSPRGNVETYLTVDLPAFVHSRFFTLSPGQDWSVAGLSEGGSCAVMLALRHPDMFGAFADYSGLVGPRIGTTNAVGDTIAVLFHGSHEEFDEHQPAALLMHHDYHHRLAGWFEVGSQDADPAQAARYLAALATAAGISAHLVVVPDQTHTFRFWRVAFADSLPWLVNRLQAGPGAGLHRGRAGAARSTRSLAAPARRHHVPVHRVG
jgi:S-formylglutathione hydrolase FrmB